jgi:hypothetical protein
MVIILNKQRDRRACGLTAHYAAEDLRSIFFDLHSSARAVSLLTAGKFFVDNFGSEEKPSGNAIKDGGEGWSVGFTCGEEA